MELLIPAFLLVSAAVWWLYYSRTKRLLQKLDDDYTGKLVRYFSRLEERMSRPYDAFQHINNGVVWAVVFTYNRQDYMEQAVRSLRAAEPSIKIVVVDNGSTDGTREVLLQLYSEGIVDKLLLNRHEDVPQWQKSYNIHQVFRMLSVEECEFLVWMDDDVVVRRPFLQAARRVLDTLADDNVALVSMLTDADQNSIHATEKECVVDGVHVRIKSSFNGAFILFPAPFLGTIGLPPIREGSDDLASEDWYYSRLLQTKGLRVAAVDFADHLGVKNSMREKMFS